MFVWSSIAHMVTPLGEAGIRQVENDQALLTTLQTTINEHGLYMFPKMNPAASMEENERKLASGPSGILVYFPRREFSFGRLLGMEFLAELLQALVAAYLLSLARLGSYAGRVGFYALAGLMAMAATNLSYWNWYGFPAAYTLPYMFTGWVGYLAAGLVAAKVLGKAPETTR